MICAVQLHFAIQLGLSIFHPVGLIHHNQVPVDLAELGPVVPAHEQLKGRQQHVKATCASSHLRRKTATAQLLLGADGTAGCRRHHTKFSHTQHARDLWTLQAKTDHNLRFAC